MLIIAYYFPPLQIVGAQRSYKTYRWAQEQGKQVRVISIGKRGHFRERHYVDLEEADILRIPQYDLRYWRGRWRKTRLHRFLAKAQRTAPLRQAPGRLRRLRDSFPFNLLLNDGGLLYMIRATWQGVRLIRREQHRELYSSFRPWSDHIVASLLKLWFGSKLHWTADFRDLHVDPLQGNVYWPRLQHLLARLILRRADAISTVSGGLARHLRRYGRPVYVHYNGTWDRGVPRLPQLFDIFTICYTGGLYPGLQSAVPLLAALHHFHPATWQFKYAGADGALLRHWASTYGVAEHIEDLGVLPPLQVEQLQGRAHLNLLLTWSSAELSGILTTKLFEYLHAGRPILCICRGTRDPELQAFAKKYPYLHLHYTDDGAALHPWLRQLRRDYERGRLPRLAAPRQLTYWQDMEHILHQPRADREEE